MTDLNNLCLRVKIGEPKAINEVFKYYKVRSIISSSVKTALSRNPEYDPKFLTSVVESEIWDEVRKNYIGAQDLSKGNNLALKFIKKIAYNRLMNFIRDDKGLKWTKMGYCHKLPKSSEYKSSGDEVQGDIVESLPDYDFETDRRVLKAEKIQVVRKVLNTLVKSEKMSVMCNYILLLKFKHNMTYGEMKGVLDNQYGEEFSEGWIGGQISNGLKMMAEMLEPYNIC